MAVQHPVTGVISDEFDVNHFFAGSRKCESGVRLSVLWPGEGLPADVGVPSQSFNEQWIVCQSLGIARRSCLRPLGLQAGAKPAPKSDKSHSLPTARYF